MQGYIVEIRVGEGFVVLCRTGIVRSTENYSLVCEGDTFDIDRWVENLLLEVECDFLVRSKHILDIGRSLNQSQSDQFPLSLP